MWDSYHQSCCRFRTAANSRTLATGSAKIRAAREFDGASIHARTPEWVEKFLRTSMSFTPCRTMRMYARLNVSTKLQVHQSQDAEGCFNLTLRTGLQSFGTDQLTSGGADSTDDSQCSTRFPSWISSWHTSAMVHNETVFTLSMMIELAEWDALMNQIVFHTTTSALSFL